MHTGYSVFNQPFVGQSANIDLEIDLDQYRVWQHQCMCHMLQGRTIGQSFCEHFGITDHALFYQSNAESALDYINSYYVA